MNTQTERYRRIRGLILKVLVKDHPRPVDKSVMHHMLDHLGYTISNEELDSHLLYLSDETKGYSRVEKKGDEGFEIYMLSITPKGLDLIDKFTKESDPGIDVEG